MDETLRKDFVSLNRKYLYLVRQMSSDQRAAMLTGVPATVIEQIRNMPIDELDALAEGMPIPCFRLDQATFEVFAGLDKHDRSAFAANILLS